MHIFDVHFHVGTCNPASNPLIVDVTAEFGEELFVPEADHGGTACFYALRVSEPGKDFNVQLNYGNEVIPYMYCTYLIWMATGENVP